MAIKRLGLLFAVVLCFASCEDTTIIEYSYPDGITEISIDASGNIWFGTKNFGVVFYNGS